VDLYECIRTRRSIRHYDPDRPVSDEDLRAVLRAASWAPSGTNAQPWHFYVVRDQALIERMRAAVIEACPDDERARRFETFFNAPCAIGVCLDTRLRPYHVGRAGLVRSLDDVYNNPDFFSVAAAIQNLLLAAHARGLGACWCKPRPTYRAELERLLGTRPHHRLVANVAIGYGKRGRADPSRKPLDEICTFVG